MSTGHPSCRQPLRTHRHARFQVVFPQLRSVRRPPRSHRPGRAPRPARPTEGPDSEVRWGGRAGSSYPPAGQGPSMYLGVAEPPPRGCAQTRRAERTGWTGSVLFREASGRAQHPTLRRGAGAGGGLTGSRSSGCAHGRCQQSAQVWRRGWAPGSGPAPAALVL